MKRRCMRIVAFVVVISVLFVQVDAVSANAVANAPRVEQGYPQIQSAGFVVEWIAGLGANAGRLVAFAFVLTLLGFVVENGISNAWENREEYLSYLTNLKEDFTSWCAESKEWCSLKVNDFDMWLDMIAQGTLDKSSDCWQAIKDYCVDLKARIDGVDSSSGSGTEIVEVTNVSEWLNARLQWSTCIDSSKVNVTGADVAKYQSVGLVPLASNKYYVSQHSQIVGLYFDDGVQLLAINSGWTSDMASDFYSNCGFGCYSSNYGKSNTMYYYGGSKGIPAFCGTRMYGVSENMIESTDVLKKYRIRQRLGSANEKNMYSALLSLATGLVNGYDDWSIEFPKDDGITDEVAQGLTVAGGASGVIERDGSLDNVDVVGVSGAKDDVIPIDWDKVSVEDLSEPYPYDDIKTVDLVDGVIVGTDTPIDKVVPPIDGTDTSSDRNNYTLSGLTELFPFCIPFDLVMLFQTLKADAVAPCFKWKFVYYVDGEKKAEDIVLDLSKFNKVAEILRMMELLAFMIALTIKTRDLIRG